MGIIDENEILERLKGKDLTLISSIEDATPLAQALWVLEIVKDVARVKKITAKTISFLLSEILEIPLDEKAIIRAFARAGDKIRIEKDGQVYYEIMTSGRRYLQSGATVECEGGVSFFTGQSAWSDANVNFPKIIESLKGDICIVDPYYGNGTFYVLEKFGKKRNIRFLSGQLGGEEQNNINTFITNLKKFKKEFKNISLRRFSKPYELHDRYIIADNALVVVGYGIKDLAEKESFVIYLPGSMVKEFLPSLKKTFEERWKKAQNIT
jgi:hypothetical protein